MKQLFINAVLVTVMATTGAIAKNSPVVEVDSEMSLRAAIDSANHDDRIKKIIFKNNVHIELNAPVIYSGTQELEVFGNNAVIDGHNAGSFELGEDLIAITEDASLIFNTASNITIHELSVVNSAARGIVINIPLDAHGTDIEVTLDRVNISNSALYGLHVDDNADAFDNGLVGSDIGVNLKISHSSFTQNGIGAIDFDGVRVDERGLGGIYAEITDTHIDMNGGDGIELDEAGPGDVVVNMRHGTLNENGFFNSKDLDDGFDIDEAGAGDVEVMFFDIEVKSNQDEGLDFDESGEGDVYAVLRNVTAMTNFDEAIKIDEEGDGDILVRMAKVIADDNGDDGIQLTELGEGVINAWLKKVNATNNVKYGIKLEQRVVEDEVRPLGVPGRLKVKKVVLNGNHKGNTIKTNNVNVI